MKITPTNYGLFVAIDGTDYTYQLRQVRTINNNNPEEQPLINRLEKQEKPLLKQFLTLAHQINSISFVFANLSKHGYCI